MRPVLLILVPLYLGTFYLIWRELFARPRRLSGPVPRLVATFLITTVIFVLIGAVLVALIERL